MTDPNSSECRPRHARGALVLCLTGLSSAVYGQSLSEQIVGTWTLVSWETRSEGAEVPGLPMSKGATGIITYSRDGYMCVNIMGPDRPRFTSLDLRGATTNEMASAFQTFIAYCGRYELDEQKRVVTHTLQTSWYPNWTGSGQKRFIEITGNRMTLTTPPIPAQNTQVIGVLTWERAK